MRTVRIDVAGEILGALRRARADEGDMAVYVWHGGAGWGLRRIEGWGWPGAGELTADSPEATEAGRRGGA